MHITAPRVLGFLMFLALIGYAFFIGPWISTNASTYSPTSSVTAPKLEPSGGSMPTAPTSPSRRLAAPDTPSRAPLPFSRAQ